MRKLILTWSLNEERKEYNLKNYKLEKVEEENNFFVLNLTLITEIETLKYRICKDTRYENLDRIEQTLNEGLKKAMEGNEIKIDDYNERDYLYFTLPGIEKRFQYTGKRIK